MGMIFPYTAPTLENAVARPAFDFIGWTHRYFHPKTQVPVFVFSAMHNGETLGEIHFYGRPSVCKLARSQRHNLHLTGVFAQWQVPIEQIADLCPEVPASWTAPISWSLPSIVETIYPSLRAGATLGALRGLSGVLQEFIAQKRGDHALAAYTQPLVFYTTYFLWCWQAHAAAIDPSPSTDDNQNAAASYSTFLQVGMDVLRLAVIEQVAKQTGRVLQGVANQLQKKGCACLSQATGFFARHTQIAVYAAQAAAQGALPVAAQTAAGFVTESVVRRLGQSFMR